MTGHGKSGELRLWYVAKDGACTTRDVRLVTSGDTYIKAFCLARQAVRTFNKAQIKWCVDLETGEIL